MTKLSDPFPAEKVSWRPGATTKDGSKAVALAYIDSRDVMDRLDEVCGVDGWQCVYPWSDGSRIVCSIGIYCPNVAEWIWKADGAGETQIEADKGAFSSSFKRAAVKWGVGRYLYDVPDVWMPLQNKRFSKETERELTQRLEAWQQKYFGVSKAYGDD